MKPQSILIITAALSALTLPAVAFEPDIIIDANEQSASVELVPAGAWSNESSTASAFRGASKVASNTTSSYFARFHTRLPKAGPYSVFVWHNGGTSYFPYSLTAQVTHADMTAANVTLSQASNAGQWLMLGTFWFEGDDDGSGTCKEAEVKLIGASASNMKLSADAVRFMPATPDITLDDSSATTTGTWTPNVPDKAAMGSLLKRSNTANSTAAYTFTVPASGDYEVSLWLPGKTHTESTTWLATGLTGATSFSVEVQHPTVGTGSTTEKIDLPALGQNEGRWVKLVNSNTDDLDAPRTGTFRFKATAAGIVNKVIIKTADVEPLGAHVPADAVRLTKVGPWATFMDEDDATSPPVPYVTATGSWANNTTLTARNYTEWYKMNFGPSWKSFNFTQSTQGPVSLTFKPQVAELGLYDVYLWFPNSYYPQNSGAAKLTVTAAAGDVVGAINQQSSSGIWRHAGRFTLHPSSAGTNPPKVKIETPTNPYNQQSQYYQWYSWWNTAQGNVQADGLMILQDAENVDTDGDGLMDWFETIPYIGTNPNGQSSDYNYVADTLGYYPEHGTLTITVTAPSGATLND